MKLTLRQSMLLATHDGTKKRAEAAGSGAIGSCPWTGLKVKAHVGLLRQYWAYEGGQPTFSRGYETETEWHIAWKTPISDDNCEVVFGANNEHRADILGSKNTVIEIQHSVIDIRDSRERIQFYNRETNRRVVWVVDIQEFWRKRFFIADKPDTDGKYLVTWKPRRTWLWDLASTTDTNLYLEFNQRNDKLLHVWIHQGEMFAKFFKKSDFFERYLLDVAKEEYKINTTLAVNILRGET